MQSEIYIKLMDKAKDVVKNSYAPYSKINVGAAILCDNEQMFTGVNIENSSYGLTMCAERVALFKAVSEGYKNFIAIAIYSPNFAEIIPCGACLQVLAEFNNDLDMIFEAEDGNIIVKKLKSFLPENFRI